MTNDETKRGASFFGWCVVFWGGVLSELSERLDSLLSYSFFVCVWCRTDEQKEAKKNEKRPPPKCLFFFPPQKSHKKYARKRHTIYSLRSSIPFSSLGKGDDLRPKRLSSAFDFDDEEDEEEEDGRRSLRGPPSTKTKRSKADQ